MKEQKNTLLTIPNALSLLRLLMIPAFVWLYLHGQPGATAAVLVLSGLTDVADGWIARHFQQISDFGKAFDPVADKLTQAAMLLCLVTTHPLMLLPLSLLVVKELLCGALALLAIRRTGVVPMAKWHGKAATALLYAMMTLHLVWASMPGWCSGSLTAACVAIMLISLVCYACDSLRVLRADKSDE